MSKKVKIEVDVKEFGVDEVSVGDYFEYKGEVYLFEGYEYGTYPIAKRLSDGEQVQLPHYQYFITVAICFRWRLESKIYQLTKNFIKWQKIRIPTNPPMEYMAC